MILVVGGSGRLGRLVVADLVSRGHEVRVLSRDPDLAGQVIGSRSTEIVRGDLRDPRTLGPAVAGVDTVVAAAHGFIGPRRVSPRTVDEHGNANLAAASAAAGADVVLMSIVGASPGHEMVLLRAKYLAEQAVRSSGARATVVRATAFAELWIDLLRQTAARSGRPLVFGRGDNPINFVSVRDVAALVSAVVADPSTRGETFEIGGPDDLSLTRLAQLVQQADGRTAPPKHLPPAVLAVVASTVGLFNPQVRRQARASLSMDRRDMTFTANDVRARFPHLPTTSVRDVLGSSTEASR